MTSPAGRTLAVETFYVDGSGEHRIGELTIITEAEFAGYRATARETLEELKPLPSRALSVGLRITNGRGRIVFTFARPV